MNHCTTNAEDLDRITRVFGDRYHVEGLVGKGWNSRVYRAKGAGEDEPVAIKVSDLARPMGTYHRRELQRNLRLAVQLRHPNLVRSMEAVLDEDQAATLVVMEFVEGRTLGEMIDEDGEGGATVGRLCDLLRQVAYGLDAIHAARLVHRDIKPQNIFVRKDALRALVGDFGVLVPLKHPAGNPAEPTVQGTPAYVAPEQIIGTSYGPPADIYSFAMTIYYCLTRTMAHDAATTRELLFAQVNSPAVPLRRRNASWPAALEEALARSLEKDPEMRHRSARALAEEVRSALRPFTPLRLSSFFRGSLSSRDAVALPRL